MKKKNKTRGKEITEVISTQEREREMIRNHWQDYKTFCKWNKLHVNLSKRK